MSKLTEQTELNNTILKLKNDIIEINGFISKEFIKIAAANNGVIDYNTETVQNAAESLLNAAPADNLGQAVLSLKATEVGIEEKILELIIKEKVQDLITKNPNMTKEEVDEERKKLKSSKEDLTSNLNEEKFNAIHQELQSNRIKLTENLSSTEGITQLVRESLQTKTLMFNSFFKDGNGISSQEKSDLANKLKDFVSFPKNITPFIREPNSLDAYVSQQTQKRMAEFFSVEGKLNDSSTCTYSPDKAADKENVKTFGAALTKDIENIGIILEYINQIEQKGIQIDNKTKISIVNENVGKGKTPNFITELDQSILKAVSSQILQNTISNIEKRYDCSKEVSKKITTTLTDALSQLNTLDAASLATNANAIESKLTKSLEKFSKDKIKNTFRGTQLSRSNPKFDISDKDLKKIATNLQKFDNGPPPPNYTPSAPPKHVLPPLVTATPKTPVVSDKTIETKKQHPSVLARTQQAGKPTPLKRENAIGHNAIRQLVLPPMETKELKKIRKNLTPATPAFKKGIVPKTPQPQRQLQIGVKPKGTSR